MIGAKMPVLLCLIFLSSKLDLSTPEALFTVQAFFATMQVACLCVGLVIFRKIRVLADETEIKYTNTPGMGQEPIEVVQTVEQYDLEQIKKFLQQIVVGSAIVGFIHYKWGSTQPLLFQGVINPINLFDMPLLDPSDWQEGGGQTRTAIQGGREPVRQDDGELQRCRCFGERVQA